MDQKFCPVCWNLESDIVSRSWETPRDIVKCCQCKHHSIRVMTYIEGDKHTSLHSEQLSRRDQTPISLAKKVFVSKKIETPKILLVSPSRGTIPLIKRVFLDGKTSMKDRRSGHTNRSISPEFYCVTSPDAYDEFLREEVRLDNCSLVNLKYGKKSVLGRQNVISEGIDVAFKKFGKFDLVITMDLLSQLLDPSLVVRSIVSCCDYFTCIENRYTSTSMNDYTNELVYKEEKNYFQNNMKLVYPIEEDHHLKDFIKDQYHFFSTASLIGIFKNEASSLDKKNLPKGKLRAFKVESIKEMYPRRQVAHNFPASYVDSL